MKRNFVKQILIAGVALLSVPSVALAQKEKDKEKDKIKEERETIIISRKGNLDEKTTIEIKGDKITVNGKEVKEGDRSADITVNRHKFRTAGPGAFSIVTPNGGWSMNMNEDGMLFNEDGNRAMLGVVTEGVSKGAEIQTVTKETAADKAGLKKGDIITVIGDKKIESSDDVTEAIRSRKPGDKVSITYLRDGKEQKTTAELGKWKGVRMNAVSVPHVFNEEIIRDMPEPPTPPSTFYYGFGGRPKLGLSIQDTDDGKGVKVLDVDDESNAAKAGIKEDDVIVSIDDQDVKSTDDVTRLMRGTARDKYTYNFKVQRNGKTQNVEVKVPRKLKTADL